MPFFSVIIPVYNRAHRLPYVLESLKRQTFQDFETIMENNDYAEVVNSVKAIDELIDVLSDGSKAE